MVTMNPLKPGKPRSRLNGAALFALALLALPGTAAAQFSKSYKFLDAVRKADGQEVTDDLSDTSTLINTHDSSTGETALQIVTTRRDLTWMNFLIAKDADVNAHDNHGQTPLVIAANLGFAEGATLLIAHGAVVDQPSVTGETPLIAAVHRRDLAMIRVLLAGGANPDRTDNSGRSARDYAALFGKQNAVSAVIEQAASHPAHAAGSYGPTL